MWTIQGTTLDELCKQYGSFPLPPYITNTSIDNQKKYQTSFGTTKGSVATPTAGLHFTPALRTALQKHHIQWQEITLHVGIGTFAPIVSKDIRDHQLHSEMISIPITLFEDIYQQKIQDKEVITIGTTSTRTIESLPLLYQLLSKSTQSQLSKECQTWRSKFEKSPQ